MSVNIETRVFPAGDGQFGEEAWALKERIRQEEGWLRQRRGFFMDAYRRAKTYALVESGHEEHLVGFASVRRDGYILFLAVDPERRGEGLGKRLIAEVARDHSSVSCHARTTNETAIEFYKSVGFEVQRRVDNYYEDRGDAYYLRLGEGGLRDKLSKFIHR